MCPWGVVSPRRGKPRTCAGESGVPIWCSIQRAVVPAREKARIRFARVAFTLGHSLS